MATNTGKIVWTDDMSVGCKTLDDDHKNLIQALNDFIEALENDEGVFATDGIFTVLVDYTIYHFAREEKLLAACNYPDLAAHIETHVALKEQLIDCRRRYMLNPNAELEDEISEFLHNWLQKHILVSDLDYRETLENSGKNIDEILADVS